MRRIFGYPGDGINVLPPRMVEQQRKQYRQAIAQGEPQAQDARRGRANEFLTIR